MKTLYLECNMGAAGDMLSAALLELHPNPDKFIERLNSLNIPGVTIAAVPDTKCGITGTHFTVTVNGEEESVSDAHHHHQHHHEHHEHHHHAGLHDIEHIVGHLNIPDKVKTDILNVYGLIAEAESHAHGKPVSRIHFHEVGMMDAVADIAAVCLLMDELSPEKVVASSVNVGFGQVRCAHGTLPIPAPATAHILRGVPTYSGNIQGEMCTPTGAALLKYFVHEFTGMPPMTVSAIGYGMGTKDFEAANCVRAMLGESEDSGDTVIKLCCNLDDMTPEAIGFAMDRLFEAGALDVFTTPIGMKKSRPGVLLTCLCSNALKDDMVRLIFRHTTTLGIRESVCRRYTLRRSEYAVSSPWGNVRVKESSGYGVTRRKAEYNDLADIAKANGLSISDVQNALGDL